MKIAKIILAFQIFSKIKSIVFRKKNEEKQQEIIKNKQINQLIFKVKIKNDLKQAKNLFLSIKIKIDESKNIKKQYFKQRVKNKMSNKCQIQFNLLEINMKNFMKLK
ncbi:hypothetical protein TTHERM_001297413 (macronuclear) [Tetrahymena thermophila SB210]|uniref:Uncharacterized protein n=1 Tax=Tetrahymena thermophila (strain SB210) TaxID=312017 RepID=W7XGK3_TETTS|nr:hypothetical protein TTHERM_001297413 [Tetrahymena thermophila SB210]EWS76143.1 hypothetical protein TTHERM_001297413 [Tetrahymena thermophila SB210]|eukprot:XP_012651322.1 hypothetical protein TTHERM_001297413 [Tetrahymena thermophila SB210]